MSVADLRAEYPELADWDVTEPDIIDDGEKLEKVAPESQDFIVANHFLEHTENPIGTIQTHLGKLKPGGVLFYAVPDKRFTFDFRRPVTPLAHMVADYEQGPEISRREHYEEWTRLVIGEDRLLGGARTQAASEEWATAKARELEETAYSIHMHVWTQAEFLDLMLEVRRRTEAGFDIEAAARQGIEFMVILRKAGALPTPPSAARPAASRRHPGRPRSAPGGGPAADAACPAGRQTRDHREPLIATRGSAHGRIVQHQELEAPVVIEVRDLKKAFRIPTHRVDSFKERIVNPMAGREYRELKALDGISFDVHQGEFFGIVGRNGSGKSTLLKILASIYRADAGTIRMAGRLAPFIELGVGFNMDLSARENVVLNGVMMGLTPKETRERLDAVIEFAELEEFAELKLKNYSSGMLVRLAFSTMMEADADIMLIDEVLAVGDAAFQQKCADAFHEMKARGQDDHPRHPRDGRGRGILPPGDADLRRPHHGDRRSLRHRPRLPAPQLRTRPRPGRRRTDPGERRGQPRRGAGSRTRTASEVTSLEEGDPIHLRAKLKRLPRRAPAIMVGFIIANQEGIPVFEFGKEVEPRRARNGS